MSQDVFTRVVDLREKNIKVSLFNDSGADVTLRKGVQLSTLTALHNEQTVIPDVSDNVLCNATESVASDQEESYAKITVGGLDEIDPTKEHKVLGTNWNLEDDTSVMKLNKIVEFTRGLEPTK